jgi:hypothetical protein
MLAAKYRFVNGYLIKTLKSTSLDGNAMPTPDELQRFQTDVSSVAAAALASADGGDDAPTSVSYT